MASQSPPAASLPLPPLNTSYLCPAHPSWGWKWASISGGALGQRPALGSKSVSLEHHFKLQCSAEDQHRRPGNLHFQGPQRNRALQTRSLRLLGRWGRRFCTSGGWGGAPAHRIDLARGTRGRFHRLCPPWVSRTPPTPRERGTQRTSGGAGSQGRAPIL